MNLNSAQKKAIQHHQGPCMVLAGPGSGKTLTIARRIQYLVEEHKVRPEEILVITFTKYASYEMKSRFQYVMEGKNLPVTFGTFHGVYYGILKWAYGFTSANIMTEDEKYNLLRQVLRTPEIAEGTDATDTVEDEQEYMKDILTEIGRIKNSRLYEEEYRSTRHGVIFQKIYELYEARRRQLKKIDFDDMLVLCYELFKARPDILKKWQERFCYILVDEFQDVNQVQYDVLRMLALPENNLFVVGDDDQSIYEFRGARPEIMLGFKKDYPETKELILEKNYRSTQNIIKGAQRVIGHNKTRYDKDMVTDNSKGETVHVQEVRDVKEECQYIIKSIQERIKQKVPLSQMAVLFRTNVDARMLTEWLVEYHIPFWVKDSIGSIYDHFIARNIKSYFHLAMEDRNRRYFLDIMNCPKRYLSRDSMEESIISFELLRCFYCDKAWMQDRIDQFEWDIKMMEKKTPYAAIQYIRKRIGYDEYIKEYASARQLQEEELFDVLHELEERAKEFQTMEEWFAHIEEYERHLKEQKTLRRREKEAVTLMTMHAAKGLEYDTVFIIAGNEGVTPYKKAKLESEIEEERRMFYVAMTRARNRLIISYVKTKNGKDLSPSRFIEELLVI